MKRRRVYHIFSAYFLSFFLSKSNSVYMSTFFLYIYQKPGTLFERQHAVMNSFCLDTNVRQLLKHLLYLVRLSNARLTATAAVEVHVLKFYS
ncbi:unnamed protein product [Ixodes persulcatus]